MACPGDEACLGAPLGSPGALGMAPACDLPGTSHLVLRDPKVSVGGAQTEGVWPLPT